MSTVPASLPAAAPAHLLLLEPRVEGHHLTWLRMVLEDLRSAGLQVSLALDHAPEAQRRWREQLSALLADVPCLPVAVMADGRSRVSAAAAAAVLERSGAEEIYMGALDEIGSTALRRAAFGRNPPAALRGRWSGIYHRPRFLEPGISPNHWLKRIGLARLLRGGWFRRILLLDEFLGAQAGRDWPAGPFHFLPTPGSQSFVTVPAEARRRLGVPDGRKVFLFFGGGYRRKGLHLVLAALREVPAGHPAFLLVAGQQPDDPELLGQLAALAAAGRALVLNRYVTAAEEELCFCASDFALLPYLNHFGTSGVLANAVHAGLPVLASDGQLLGRRVREHRLGWLFPDGDVPALRAALVAAAAEAPATLEVRRQAVRCYAATCTREAFRAALLTAFGLCRA